MKNKEQMITMESQITILGSGTCVPSLVRNPCALVMKTEKDHLLFDCGPGVMRRLLETGISIFDISTLFLSHFHPDHSGELASFLFSLKYSSFDLKQRLLTIVAGRGFKLFFDRLQTAYENHLSLPEKRLRIIEMDTARMDQHAFSTFTVTSMPVAHRPESLAYRITDRRGKQMVYTGDTDVCDGLTAIAAGADLMICDSAFPDGQKVDGHLTPSLAGQIAQAAGVKRLVLTHFYPPCETVDIENQCRSTYNGSLVLARDLMTLIL
ncbi:Rnz2: predicted ribonuclease Z (tRNA 3 endonuclease) [Desulfosarcina variabilis str. Montpellier]